MEDVLAVWEPCGDWRQCVEEQPSAMDSPFWWEVMVMGVLAGMPAPRPG